MHIRKFSIYLGCGGAPIRVRKFSISWGTSAHRGASTHRGASISWWATTISAPSWSHGHRAWCPDASSWTVHTRTTRWNAPASGPSHAASRHGPAHGHARAALLRGRRPLHRQRDHVLPADQHETQSPFLLFFSCLCFSRLELPEFFAIRQNQVHVLIEGFELANECPRVLKDDLHAVIQIRSHLVAFTERHLVASGEG